MEVLIVSKTHMSNAACVGGLVLSNNRFVRLLNNGNYNQPTDTNFSVGDVWDLSFHNRINLIPPHIEDVVLTSKSFIRKVDNLPDLLKQRRVINWNGHINNLFDGKLLWTNSGTGYIPINGEMPTKSVGFWVADKDLIRVTFDAKIRYRYPNGNTYRNISYVGFQETILSIPVGTILRLSLSRTFPPENSTIPTPRGFYLQLSGWYIEGEKIQQSHQPLTIDDLPL